MAQPKFAERRGYGLIPLPDAKSFRPWDVDQIWLLPGSIMILCLPDIWFAILCAANWIWRPSYAYEEERGQPPYHAAMMVGSPEAPVGSRRSGL